jgi:hypothetical protein
LGAPVTPAIQSVRPHPGLQPPSRTLFYTRIARHLWIMQIPVLDATSYYNFLSGLMITLFVISLIIIFAYEYEVLRRPKT